MGRRTQAFKARLAPVETQNEDPQRGLTWPQLQLDPTTPQPQLHTHRSINSDTRPCPDTMWNRSGLTEIISVSSDASEPGDRVSMRDNILDAILGEQVGCSDTSMPRMPGSEEGTAEQDEGSEGGSFTEEGGTIAVRRKRRHRGRRGKAWVPPAAPNHFVDRPCEHNSWDNVRVKKDKTTLRCRVCQLQWKVDHTDLREGAKCPEFHASGRCSKGDRCQKIHIHRCKLNLSKRKAIWGEQLLVPRTVPDICQPVGEPALRVACTGLEQRIDTNPDSTETAYPLATPHASCPPALRRQSITSGDGLRLYSHQPYDFQLYEPAPSTSMPQLISPVESSLPDLVVESTPGEQPGSGNWGFNMAGSRLSMQTSSSMPSLWTAGASTPSRRDSLGFSKSIFQRRTSTGSASTSCSPNGPSSPPAYLAAQSAVRGYYPPQNPSGITTSPRSAGAEADGRRRSSFANSATAIPSPTSETSASCGIESYPSCGTLPVPHIVSLPVALRARCPPKERVGTKSWADEEEDMWENEEVMPTEGCNGLKTGLPKGWLPDSAAVWD